MLLFLILYLNGFKWTLTYLMNRDLSEVVKKSTCCCYRADCLWKVSIIFSHLNCGYKDSELYFSLPSTQPSKLGGLVMLRVLNFVDCMGEPKLIYSWLQIFRRFHPAAGKELSCSGTAELRNVTVNVGRALFGGSGFWHLYFLVWYSQAASPICMIVIYLHIIFLWVLESWHNATTSPDNKNTAHLLLLFLCFRIVENPFLRRQTMLSADW